MGHSSFASLLVLTAALAVASGPAASQQPFVAGVEPSKRPAGAPVIEEFAKDDGWYALARKGVQEPYPESLRFLEDQGAWYTPFNHPGAPHPYDLRNWHSPTN